MKKIEVNAGDKKIFALIFLALLLVTIPGLLWLEKRDLENELAKAQVKSEWSVQMEYSIVSARISSLVADTSYLHDVYATRLENPAEYDKIAQEWVIFSNKMHVYDQMRFIDADGNERIRIDLKREGAIKVPAEELQNKSDRYYFYEAANLPVGALHVSPLDLNIERGQIETPFKPMIRLGMPVHKADGTLLGVIVMNYLAKDFLSAFKEYAITSENKPVLLNAAGYYLASHDAVQEWGFMFDKGKNRRFDVSYPEEWAGVQQGQLRQYTEHGLFTALPIKLRNILLRDAENNATLPHTIYCDETWYIVGMLPRDEEHPYLYTENMEYMFSYLISQPAFVILVLLAIFAAFLGAQTVQRYRQIHYRADYDALTKAYSREGGMSKLRFLAHASKGIDMTFSICFVDVNGLKEVNDNLGHDCGDEMIVTAVNTVNAQIRQHDYIIRIGGDEFLIVFPYSDVEQAEKVWQRIKAALERINRQEQRPYCISLSHGIVDNRSSQHVDVDKMIKMADVKMYEEKQEIKKAFCSVRVKDLNVQKVDDSFK